jgi:homoserine kinase
MDLIPFALEGERMASGTAHADNVAPSLLGGLCLIRSYNPLDIIEIPVRNNFFWVVAHPNVVVETKVAREILPTMIPLESMIRQSGNLAGLITGLISGDEKIIKHSLRDDVIEPVRSRLIPAFNEVKQAAIAAGALAFSISGSGPSVFAVARTQEIALRIGAEIKNTFNKAAFLSCDVYISKINMNGSTLLETEE